MKITIKNKAIALISYLFSFKKIFFAFILFFISTVIVGIASSETPTLDGFLGLLISFTPPILYLIYQLIDGLMYINKTYIEVKDNGVEIHSGNIFNNTNISSLYSQTSNMGVFQDWKFKIFGICQISVTQSDSIQYSVWGFDYREAQEFVDKLSDKFQIKIKV